MSARVSEQNAEPGDAGVAGVHRQVGLGSLQPEFMGSDPKTLSLLLLDR